MFKPWVRKLHVRTRGLGNCYARTPGSGSPSLSGSSNPRFGLYVRTRGLGNSMLELQVLELLPSPPGSSNPGFGNSTCSVKFQWLQQLQACSMGLQPLRCFLRSLPITKKKIANDQSLPQKKKRPHETALWGFLRRNKRKVRQRKRSTTTTTRTATGAGTTTRNIRQV